MRRGAIVGPVIVIGIGVLFLLNNLGLGFPLHELLHNGWPFILILVGILQLLGGFAGRGSLPAGLILVTVGALFAFERMLGVSFRYTWPVLLIVVGGIGLMRAVLGPAYLAGRFRGGWTR